MSRSLEYQYTWSQLIFTCSLSKIDTLEKGVKSFAFFFFDWDSLYARPNSHHEAWSYKKRSTKRLHDTENLFKKNLQLKDVC